MKILFLTQYDESGASSQVRVYQFLEEFRRAGAEPTVRPLIPRRANAVLAGLTRFAGPVRKLQTLLYILSRYLGRVSDVLFAGRFDGVVVQKDVLPFGLGRLLFFMQKNVIFEFDDPIWLPHESVAAKGGAGGWMVRYRKHCLDYLLARSRLVICDTPKMQDYVRQLNPNTFLFSSPVDVSTYEVEPRPSKDPHLLWIGSPSTSYLLMEILPAIEKLARSHPLTLVNIGGVPIEGKGFAVKNVPWSVANVKEWGSVCHFGLAPGEQGAFNQYKYAYKIWIYSALGLPTLASNTGLNPISLEDGKSGSLYRHGDESDFVEKARALLTDPETAHRMGIRAKEWVVQGFDLKSAGPRLAKVVVDRLGANAK